MQIVTLTQAEPALVRQAATLLVEGFGKHAPLAWPTMDAALEEVQEGLAVDRIIRGAVDTEHTLLGWIGGISHYDGYVWELHPLVVSEGHRRQGVGRALVADLERQVKARGGVTIQLGTDDENGRTSLSGIDLYPEPLAHLARIRNLSDHPYEFYQKVGFAIIGIVPDANGWGKPDILMAKRVA